MKPPHITAWSGEVGYVIRPDPLVGNRPAVFAASGKPGDGAPVWGRISEERQRRAVALRRARSATKWWSATATRWCSPTRIARPGRAGSQVATSTWCELGEG